MMESRISRRSFIRAVATSGLLAAGCEIPLFSESDPYQGLTVPEYINGQVSIDLRGVNIRVAPNLDPKSLKQNNPEGHIDRWLSSQEWERKTGKRLPNVEGMNGAFYPEPFRGPIVEINGVSAKDMSKIFITNPAIVRGQNPEDPTRHDGTWMILNTQVTVPGPWFNIASSPGWGEYVKAAKLFYISFSPSTCESVKLVDSQGNIIAGSPNILGIVNDRGKHLDAVTNKAIPNFGKVLIQH